MMGTKCASLSPAFISFFIALALLFPILRPSDAATPPSQEEKTARDAAAQAILDSRLPEVRLDQTGFNDAIQFIRDVTSANITVNWKAIESAGIPENAPVSARLRDVKLSTALTTILNNVSGGDSLSYEIEDGVLTISTVEDLANHTVITVYDIRDLLSTAGDEKQREHLATQFMDLIKDTLQRGIWDGNAGAIKHLAGQLIINASRENHRQITQLLEQLRRTRAIEVIVDARLLSVTPRFLADQKLQVDEMFTVKKTGEKINAQFLDPARVADILKSAKSAKDVTTLTVPRVAAFVGQQGLGVVAQQQAYVRAWTEAKPGQARREIIDTAQTGVFLELIPSVSPDRKYVTLVMHPRVSQLLDLKPVPWDKAPGENLMVQRPDMDVWEVNTTISIPDEGTLVVRLKHQTEQFKEAADKALLLLLRPRIIVPLELEPEAFPRGVNKPQ